MAGRHLQQLDRIFLTDGGMETDLIFNQGIELPAFSAVTLLATAKGEALLKRYYEDYLGLAREAGTGLILESATWRASPGWAAAIGLSSDELDRLNVRAIELLKSLRAAHGSTSLPIVVSGCIGPRGDGYVPGAMMSADEAADYHGHQAGVLASAGADMLCAMTINYVNEAIGIARAAGAAGIPVAISFTVETDGRLPAGDTLRQAIEAVDSATGGYPAYYMVNCAHPSHFASALLGGEAWVRRIRGIRANASRCSHAELEQMTELDVGNPVELGEDYRALRAVLPQLTVLGGCCGTDQRHVRAIAEACVLKAAA